MNFPILVKWLRNELPSTSLSSKEWELIVRQARNAKVLGSVAARVKAAGDLHALPEPLRNHLESAILVAEQQKISVNYELQRIEKALHGAVAQPIALKGAAYLLADLPLADGRMFSDIDLFFPRAEIPLVESQLLMHGWIRKPVDDYDNRYYREWMHEIPPLVHFRRGSVLDIHHNIVPTLRSYGPDPTRLLLEAIPDYAPDGFRVLKPVDMILHSTAHLFLETDFSTGFRGILDLDGLFRHFGNPEQPFWMELIERAEAHNLVPFLKLGLRYSHRILNTPLPEPIIAWSRISFPKAKLLDLQFNRALLPRHSTCKDGGLELADFLLLCRGHALKMPLTMLLPHLIHKSIFRLRSIKDEKAVLNQ